MQSALPWMIACALLGTLAVAGWAIAWRARRPRKPAPLPPEWALSARPVFGTNERRAYRHLREAFPQHIVLAKLPLVRLCQPNDPQDVRFWYDLLGTTHVTFAVCSANGRVLAAIDLEVDGSPSRRAQAIKKSVLGACRIRYFRCPVDPLPTVPELQLLVPSVAAPARGHAGAASHGVDRARDDLTATVAMRRRTRGALWHDSGFFHDSFFTPDGRADVGPPSEYAPLTPSEPGLRVIEGDDMGTARNGWAADDQRAGAGEAADLRRFGGGSHR